LPALISSHMPQPLLREESTRVAACPQPIVEGQISCGAILDAVQRFQLQQQQQNDSLQWSLQALTAEVQALAGALAALGVSGKLAITAKEPTLESMIATADQKREPAEGTADLADQLEDDDELRVQKHITAKYNLQEDNTDKDVPKNFVRRIAYKLVYHPYFERGILIVILVNMICIGIDIETHIRAEKSFVLSLLDHVFLSIYVFELTSRFAAEGLKCFRNPWVVFDLLLVFLGVSISWIMIPLSDIMGGVSHNSSLSSAKRVLLLRFARLVRLIRALRFMQLMKSLWRLTAGMINAWNTIFSMALMLTMAIYVFSCLGAELISTDDDLRRDQPGIVQDHFASIPGIMLTLVQFINVDSCASIYRPLITQRPVLGIYFFAIILILSITLMNLVTALLVEAGIESGQNEKAANQEQTKQVIRSLAPEIREAFRRVDTDGSGCLTQKEIAGFASGLPGPLLNILHPGNMVELFESLDEDGSGEVGELEFLDGILEAALSNLPFEVQQQLKLLRIMLRKLSNLEEKFQHPLFTCMNTKFQTPNVEAPSISCS